MDHFLTENYLEHSATWPKQGNHILAQFDDETIVVYQAFKPSIADYAVQHQKFGGENFSFSRMSWIKTNFLWMMYRCGWASKHGQERVLAVRILRKGFDEILSKAYSAQRQKTENLESQDIEVRLQWDPDHSPTYSKEVRRAIQLGLKGEVLRKYATEWISSITDITDFVTAQKSVLDNQGIESLLTAKEEVYPVASEAVREKIGLD